MSICDKVRERTRKTIAELADPNRICADPRGRDFTLRWVMNHAIAHESYSGGQIVMLSELYKRMK